MCSFTKTTQTMLFKTLTPYYLFSSFTEYDLCSWVRNPVLLLFIMERLKDQAEYKWGETELQQKAKQGVEPHTQQDSHTSFYKTTGEAC